jgi:hypothetical protein
MTIPVPPRPLGVHGDRLWQAIELEFDIVDVASLELLCLACQALDRAESLRGTIDRDGDVIQTESGPRPHPALKDELNAMTFVRQTLRALGLVYEPVRSGPGRPSGTAWRGRQKIHAD